MRLIARDKREQNRAAVDPWTAVHAAAGLAFGLMNVPLGWAAGLSLGYEVAEQFFERMELGQEVFEVSGPESLPNAAVDMIALLVGYRLGRSWNRTGGR